MVVFCGVGMWEVVPMWISVLFGIGMREVEPI